MAIKSSFPQYRLRGLRDFDVFSFDLGVGEHLLGSSPQADLVVAVQGVSRRHARLRVDAESVEVEDLGSTNGTVVAGQRLDAGRRLVVPAASEICFGPAAFELQAVPSDDAELALVFESPPRHALGDDETLALPGLTSAAPEKPFDPEETTIAFGAHGSDRAELWLDWIDGFVTALGDAPRGSLAGALAFLGGSVGAEACCVVRWNEGEAPVVVAAWGDVGELPGWRQLQEHAAGGAETELIETALIETALIETVLIETVLSETVLIETVLIDDDPPLAVALAGDVLPALGLVVQGQFLGRARSARLGTLARLVAISLDRGGRAPVTLRPPAVLRFPDGYRRGISPPMKRLYTQMESLVEGDLSVLIRGETGAGKELVARILHDSSERRDRPFVAVNCAAIPAELLEAEMFGIDKGVATGVDARLGKFRHAEGGTLFLDEIGEMAPALQAKLLRALQEDEIHPVGGRGVKIDVRVISATNVDLTASMESGKLRPDLYYRLAGFLLEVPPVRECVADLPGLIEHFVRRFSAEKGIGVRGMTVAALKALSAYPWPGNVRELEQEIRRLVYLSIDGAVIDLEKLSDHVQRIAGGEDEPDDRLTAIVRGFESLEAAPCLALFEEILVREALRRSQGNKSAASRLLGVSRNGLEKKLKRLGIAVSGS